ncbi:histidine kinase [Aureisphaera galaxeae]|uniref:sensor histidine kinase n=1 Tax=Aureisphaera galaxeae TaxID=1538023 RepID=UPI0023503D9F|nr:histidine kinase [Aureisphaera galaxeae]MDC8002833.1 histidine kinase [Aureisphaera galaxeae]
MQNLETHWFFRYKLHHLVFWSVYHYLWWSFYMNSSITAFESLGTPIYLTKFLLFVLVQAAGVYFCLYYLIPKFLEKGKILSFLLLTLITVVFMAFVIMLGIYMATALAGMDYGGAFKYHVDSVTTVFKKDAFPSSVSSMTFGISIKLAKNWLDSNRRRQELEREKLESELKFLKSQFNPHFLFNTINSIFVLIDKNSKLASESLSRFSELLRYQLYECNEPQIPLSKELQFIQSFLTLERLRYDDHVEIKTEFPKTYDTQWTIAPFVLMPFIENAFKHFHPTKEHPSWVHLKLHLEGDQLSFEIINSKPPTGPSIVEVVDYGGLGLKNVQRRLELIYPNAHELNISDSLNTYKVSLRMTLEADTQSIPIPKAI